MRRVWWSSLSWSSAGATTSVYSPSRRPHLSEASVFNSLTTNTPAVNKQIYISDTHTYHIGFRKFIKLRNAKLSPSGIFYLSPTAFIGYLRISRPWGPSLYRKLSAWKFFPLRHNLAFTPKDHQDQQDDIPLHFLSTLVPFQILNLF